MTEAFHKSDSEAPREPSLIQFIDDLAHSAVLLEEALPVERIRERAIAMGFDDKSVNIAVMLGSLAYADAVDIIENGVWPES